MSTRSPIVLLMAASVALALAPVLAVIHGTFEPIGLLVVLLGGLALWGAIRKAGWVQPLVVGLALWELREVWVSWRLRPELRDLVPYYTVWRGGHVAAALLLAGAAAALLAERPAVPPVTG